MSVIINKQIGLYLNSVILARENLPLLTTYHKISDYLGIFAFTCVVFIIAMLYENLFSNYKGSTYSF